MLSDLLALLGVGYFLGKGKDADTATPPPAAKRRTRAVWPAARPRRAAPRRAPARPASRRLPTSTTARRPPVMRQTSSMTAPTRPLWRPAAPAPAAPAPSRTRTREARRGLPSPDVTRYRQYNAPTVMPKRSSATAVRERATIRRGSRGGDVAEWQGVIGVTRDGDFGPKTEAATKSWQASHSLVPDGIVGPKTWGAAYRAGAIK